MASVRVGKSVEPTVTSRVRSDPEGIARGGNGRKDIWLGYVSLVLYGKFKCRDVSTDLVSSSSPSPSSPWLSCSFPSTEH
jgi:hypothetical protein